MKYLSRLALTCVVPLAFGLVVEGCNGDDDSTPGSGGAALGGKGGGSKAEDHPLSGY
jgi:hypothetical protein